jgi:hypothetical protein
LEPVEGQDRHLAAELVGVEVREDRRRMRGRIGGQQRVSVRIQQRQRPDDVDRGAAVVDGVMKGDLSNCDSQSVVNDWWGTNIAVSCTVSPAAA